MLRKSSNVLEVSESTDAVKVCHYEEALPLRGFNLSVPFDTALQPDIVVMSGDEMAMVRSLVIVIYNGSSVFGLRF